MRGPCEPGIRRLRSGLEAQGRGASSLQASSPVLHVATRGRCVPQNCRSHSREKVLRTNAENWGI